jgi:hypothetical protein
MVYKHDFMYSNLNINTNLIYHPTMTGIILPPEIIEIIARKNVIVYVKLRECCQELARLLPVNTINSFYLRPTLVREPGSGRMTARSAITYTIAGKYIIKHTRITKLMYHVAIWLNLSKIMDLRPRRFKNGVSDWIYPDAFYYVENKYVIVNKYYDREGDGLICRLIVTRNKVSAIVRYSIWYNDAYHVLELDKNGRILNEHLSSTIREYYPPHIKPDNTLTLE